MNTQLKGGRKTVQTNKRRYGDDYYKRIGRLGGLKSTGGGFASNKVGADGLTGFQRAKIAGAKGGKMRRHKLAHEENKEQYAKI